MLSLLGMGDLLGPPEVSYDATGTGTFVAAADSFDVDAAPLSLVLELGQRPLRVTDPRDFQMHIKIGDDGTLLGGVDGNDLYLQGKVVDRVGTVFDGVLLTGEVVAYGELNAGTGLGADKFDFRFTPTGGLLMPYFENYDIGVDMTLTYFTTSTPYDGSFAANFSGHAQGVLGIVEKLAPPPPQVSSVAGSVTLDGSQALAGVSVSLSGTDLNGNAVSQSTVTNEQGQWSFIDLLPGTYAVSAAQAAGMLDGDETAGSLGGTVGDDVIGGIVITGGQAGTGYSFNEITPGGLAGFVYEDFNNDSEIDFNEKAIGGVTVTLTGTNDRGQAVEITDVTDSDGVYYFTDLRPGTYAISETQAAGFSDGMETLGTAGGVVGADQFTGISVSAGADGLNYNFGERPLAGVAVTHGQTATIGYWQNKNGQNLIKALNGSVTATQLGDWLAATMPGTFGNLAGKTNAQVAQMYVDAFKAKKGNQVIGPAKLDCQVMATAFAVYATNQSLAGTAASAFGFLVTASGVGTATFNVGLNGAAFDVANYSVMTVLDLLLATDSHTAQSGVLYSYTIVNPDGTVSYGIDAVLRAMANEVFTKINESGDIV